jgi:PucR family transcriptional regulator, purine catabolism regulatory protein
VASFEALRSAVLPNARWLVPEGAAAGDLAWVRLLRARVPAFDALERGDVAIIPAASLAIVAPDDDTVGAVVRGAADAGVGGIVLVADAGGARRPAEELVRAAAAAGIPVLDAGPGDPAAIERSAIGFLVNHRAELERQATLLETRLEGVALSGGGPDGMAAAISGFLGRPVAIEGRRGAALVVHAPPDAPDAAAAVARYHRRGRAAAARIPLPLPGGEEGSAGALALLGDRPPTELERVATARIAGLVALELARDEAVGRAREAARHEALPADGPPWVVIVARQPAPEAEAVRRELRALAPARRLVLRGDAQSVDLRVVVAAPRDDPAAIGIAARVGSLLGRPVAVSRPIRDPSLRSAAEAEARSTLEAVERLEAAPAVARADRLPAYRLMGNLHNLPEGARQARALLEPLLQGRTDVRRERLATLRAVLDQPGLAEAAAALGVHRNTIAYRVHRIEESTGWSLADPELRFPLALALRLVQDD